MSDASRWRVTKQQLAIIGRRRLSANSRTFTLANIDRACKRSQ
jgi:hypothetical protein